MLTDADVARMLADAAPTLEMRFAADLAKHVRALADERERLIVALRLIRNRKASTIEQLANLSKRLNKESGDNCGSVVLKVYDDVSGVVKYNCLGKYNTVFEFHDAKEFALILGELSANEKSGIKVAI